MSVPDLLVAVDGGGTRTRSAVADLDGRILARGFGPSSNLQDLGLKAVGKALTTAIEGALMQVPGAGWKGEGPVWQTGRIAAICFGLAGVDTREDEARLSQWVRDQGTAARFSILNDSELVLACGTPDRGHQPGPAPAQGRRVGPPYQRAITKDAGLSWMENDASRKGGRATPSHSQKNVPARNGRRDTARSAAS